MQIYKLKVEKKQKLDKTLKGIYVDPFLENKGTIETKVKAVAKGHTMKKRKGRT